MNYFFRLGDVVLVKDLDCLRNEGIAVYEAEDDYGNPGMVIWGNKILFATKIIFRRG